MIERVTGERDEPASSARRENAVATPHSLLGLQRAAGNRATARWVGSRPVVQRQPMRPMSVPATAAPERFPTYEGWIATFRSLETFSSEDTVGADPEPYRRWRREHHRPDPGDESRDPAGFRVFGDRPADRPFEPGAGPHAAFDRPRVGDGFVDHPTEAWLRRHLPPNLISTAYELPSDCADVAFILRHVWLSAHHRLERHSLNGRPVLIGDRRGRAVPDQVRRQTLGPVDSWSFAGLVQPYLGGDGRPLRTFAGLQALLHPGDVLVWAHHDQMHARPGRRGPQRGGHVQTVMRVDRSGGRVSALHVVQGNQPLFLSQALDVTRALGLPGSQVDGIRATPGRRIESAAVEVPRPAHDVGVWTSNLDASDWTVLVAAGPPASVPRPTGRGRVRGDHLGPWLSVLRRTSVAGLVSVLAGALADLRAAVEGGAATTPPGVDPLVFARRLGSVVGSRLGTRGAPSRAEVVAVVEAFVGLDQGPAAAARVRAVLAEVVGALPAARRQPEAAVQRRSLGAEVVGDRGRWSPAGGAAVSVQRDPPTSATPRYRPPAAWVPVVAAASDGDLEQVFIDALTDAAALRRAGRAVPAAEAARLGRVAGERVWESAHSAAVTNGASGVEHFRRLGRVRESIRAVAGGLADAVDRAFERAARGMTTVRFPAARPDRVGVLVTGFDPFRDASGVTMPWAAAGPAHWNPSGAVALAMDGEEVPLPGGRVAVVQSAVFPVSFRDFDRGIVEDVLGPLARQVDAVITVSLDPDLGMTAPVRLEQFAVGTRWEGGSRRVGGPQFVGPPAIRSEARLGAVAHAVAHDPMGTGTVPEPDVGVRTVLRFTPAHAATVHQLLDQAVGGMHPPAQRHGGELAILDDRALSLLLARTRRDRRGVGVTVRLDGRGFHGDVVEGPGGSFLSNEIAYRSQHLLRTRHARAAGAAFHIHTAGAPAHQQPEPSDREAARRLTIEAVRRTVRAVATEVAAGRAAP